MALFDIFTGKPARRAAEQQRTLAMMAQQQAQGALDAGNAQAMGYLSGSEDRARADIGRGLADAISVYGTARDTWRPLGELFGRGSALRADALGVNGAAGTARARAAFEASPGYRFTLDEGLEALNRRRAAAGMLASGNSDHDAIKFATGLASTEHGNWLDRLGSYDGSWMNATSGETGAIGQMGAAYERGGALKADLAGGTGRTLASLASGAGRDRANLYTSTAETVGRTHRDEAEAEMQGSASLWGTGLTLAKLAAGLRGSGRATGGYGSYDRRRRG